mmetsp:Transcript_3180/g.6492  ORF Transcript_3180/g.6492 Transcript_3180/m.6492 type:complete len:250 (+) Transcript_3180:53-802(+)|eukprot:CAMPEP_0182556632 /NCGR_PEP_ID=MMETSP1324-20130603/825_1 /TAXON_ID=236786 /ORGANISM="Florenciella sp., Strain RCC1587" /LENGTH=249 /DNA_ID=CAMNT_0024768553 /DNA_START=53 /DNA_END=802 /DNA_ORIENTATION=-
MRAFVLALALVGASAFTPSSVRPLRVRSIIRAEEEAAAEEAAPVVEEPAPAPAPAPVDTRAYLETMYGGLGEPETGGKIPPMAYMVADIGTPGTMDFMRAAELKHARIAMIGFMGWVANIQNVHFPGMLSASKGISFESLESVNGVDAFFSMVPAEGLGQIFAFAAVFEWYEMTHKDGKWNGNNALQGEIVPNINKWDILGFTEGKTEDDLKRVKLQELKNGRMAMIGTLGCVAAATIPGSVPFLTGSI